MSLTRTVFGGAPQDDVLHVWVEPIADSAGAGRLEWREDAHEHHPRERWVSAEGRFQAVVRHDEASGQWHVRITDLHDGTLVHVWEAGDTRAQAMSAANARCSR